MLDHIMGGFTGWFLGVVVPVISAIWVLNDAHNRNYSKSRCLISALAVLIFWVIALPIYILCRPRLLPPSLSESIKLCPHCGKYYDGINNPVFCPLCDKEINPPHISQIKENTTKIKKDSFSIKPIEKESQNICSICGQTIPEGHTECFFCADKYRNSNVR